LTSLKPTYKPKNSLRLQGYDYSSEGVYFITIGTENRISHFGKVDHDKVLLSNSGKIVAKEWKKTPHIRNEVILGEWVIMPNHFHALLAFKAPEEIENSSSVSADGHPPKQGSISNYKNSFGPQSKNLSALVRSFKASCTSQIRSKENPYFAWQRSFHDRVVRNQKELERIQDYIYNNPLKFSLTNNSALFNGVDL
jgi:REP element-mobilizing transposase RayT